MCIRDRAPRGRCERRHRSLPQARGCARNDRVSDLQFLGRHVRLTWTHERGPRSSSARGGNAIAQLTRLSEELCELLHGDGPVRNVAMGARRENPCHTSTPQVEGVRVRTPGQAAYALPAPRGGICERVALRLRMHHDADATDCLLYTSDA